MLGQRLKTLAVSAVLCGALGAAAINGAFAAPNNETATPGTTPLATSTPAATGTTNPARPQRAMGPHGRFGWGMGGEFGKPMADFLGISTNDLQTALKNGQTLAQIGQAHGKSAEDLKGFLKDQLKTRLDEAVKNGKLTADQETKLLDQASARFDQVINATLPQRPAGVWGGHGRHGGGQGRVESLSSIAGFLGINASDLRTELQGGKTLTDVAQAHGKSAADLKTFLMDQAAKQIDSLLTKKFNGPGKAQPAAAPTSQLTPQSG